MTQPDPINYQRLYEYRFQGIDQAQRQAVWNEIARWIHARMGSPARVLDPAAGRGEFVNALSGIERWVIDLTDFREATLDPDVKVVIGNALDVDLPPAYFDGVFVSNFLEHLATQADVARFLGRMRTAMSPNGMVAILGPNFRYCAKTYFDCADHTLALTHVAVEEHLHAAGFTVETSIPRLLPYSFRSVLPAWPALTRAYLRVSPAWRLLGKQFLVLAKAPAC